MPDVCKDIELIYAGLYRFLSYTHKRYPEALYIWHLEAVARSPQYVAEVAVIWVLSAPISMEWGAFAAAFFEVLFFLPFWALVK